MRLKFVPLPWYISVLLLAAIYGAYDGGASDTSRCTDVKNAAACSRTD